MRQKVPPATLNTDRDISGKGHNTKQMGTDKAKTSHVADVGKRFLSDWYRYFEKGIAWSRAIAQMNLDDACNCAMA